MNWRAGAIIVTLISSCCFAAAVAHGADAAVEMTATATGSAAEPRSESSRRVQPTHGGGVFSASAAPAATDRDRTWANQREKSFRNAETDGAGIVLLVRRAVVAIVLSGFLGVALWMVLGKRSGRITSNGSADGLELLATLTLAPRCFVSLIRAQDQTILIARDSSGVKQMKLLPRGFDGYLDEQANSASSSLTQLQQH